LGRVCFPFSKQKSEAFGTVARPIARVTLRSASGEPFDITALVDSGADVSMFSPSVARILGLDVKRGQRKTFHSLGGAIDAYVHRINLQLGTLHLKARVAFPEVEVPNLLGRLDILGKSVLLFKDEDEVCLEY